jgi:hypothetical protein
MAKVSTFAPQHPKHAATDHRVRHADLLAGFGHQVAEHVHDADPDQQGDEDLPAAQPEDEQTSGSDVSADAVHIGHPEREDVVRTPGLCAQRREVLIGQPGVVAGLDQAATDRLTGGFDEVRRGRRSRPADYYALITRNIYLCAPSPVCRNSRRPDCRDTHRRPGTWIECIERGPLAFVTWFGMTMVGSAAR